jgi:hypothetical protein
VLKHGFNLEMMQRGLDLRLQSQDLLAPHLLEVDRERGIYVEPLIHATVADRLLDRKRARSAMHEAALACHRLARHTQRHVAWDTWWSRQRHLCEVAAKLATDSDDAIIKRALRMHTYLGQQLQERTDLAMQGVEISQSHGDLQAGNVLVEGRRIWLIDWERVDERIAAYDLFTWLLNSRHKYQGLMQRIQHVLGDLDPPRQTRELRALLESQSSSTPNLHRALLFVLEEIRFHLEECASGPLFGTTPALRLLTEELETPIAQQVVASLLSQSSDQTG